MVGGWHYLLCNETTDPCESSWRAHVAISQSYFGQPSIIVFNSAMMLFTLNRKTLSELNRLALHVNNSQSV